MHDNLPPMAPRNAQLRTRVAVPVPPPMLKPSLIPVDVLQDMRREEAVRVAQADAPQFDHEPRTAPIAVVDEPVHGEVKADIEVAIFALSQVPLFRSLPVASLEALADGARQLEVPSGEVLFVEGDEASSFFVVVDGALEVLRHKDGREVAVRHTGKGEAFGLFGLFAGQLRAATTRAIGDCTVLEISAQKLQALLDHDDALHGRLLAFYRERLVEGFMTSKLFADLVDSIARARLIGRFKHVELQPGTVLLSPGEVSNLILVVTHGRLMLEDRARPGQAPTQFEVTQGQFLSVTAALSGVPGKLRIYADEAVSVSMLSQKDLHELMVDYPALRSMPARLPTFARQLDRAVFCGTTGVPGL
jgi:CRP-like cAMP-binding protein